MKKSKSMLIAFILNSAFSLFEFAGGIFTGSISISADALHDLLDAVSIGISLFLEKKSETGPDDENTYGGGRLSVLGGFITALVLLIGSVSVVVTAIGKIIHPSEINYDGMLVVALIGTAVNLAAAFFTRGEESLNRRAVNLHMLEDALGWVAVLLGALVMKLTDFSLIDPLLSIAVAIFIFINAAKTFTQSLNILLDKTPKELSLPKLQAALLRLPRVDGIHHLHVWSIDSENTAATVHIVSHGEPHEIKHLARECFREFSVSHVTVELEAPDEHCHEEVCSPRRSECHHHHHHHH